MCGGDRRQHLFGAVALIGQRVRVTAGDEIVRIHHGGREVVNHAELKGRHGRIVDDAHLAGLVGTAEWLVSLR
ncbi:Mu transposase domain-containing protein [Bosea sp. 2YAB26]|uniref:Mu transposase domain-containing protein n=1 Tax=Bosea sp. 2YAB26 TaxID=3237478 RepID=UPI003F916747